MNVALVQVLGLLLIGTAVALIRVRDLFATLALLSVFSGLSAVLLALLGAVDVAFTEAVVGAGLSTVMLMALLRRVDVRQVTRRPFPAAAGAVLLAGAVAAVLVAGALMLPAFGDPQAPAHLYLSPEYGRRAIPETGSPNVVTAVLADYRGFDTLIETGVVATAALGCLLVRGREP